MHFFFSKIGLSNGAWNHFLFLVNKEGWHRNGEINDYPAEKELEEWMKRYLEESGGEVTKTAHSFVKLV